MTFLPIIILRHRKENLKKCSLRGLEGDSRFNFFSYPLKEDVDFSNAFLLSMDGPLLSLADSPSSLILLDGTWRYAEKMEKVVPKSVPKRSLPKGLVTAYPRKQEDCIDPSRGLASVEALYVACLLTGRNTTGILDQYHWKKQFLEKNLRLLSDLAKKSNE